jgi:hypothetical protein
MGLVDCFNLVWRGSLDGFGAKEFRSRCDGHANTLTLIRDASGNIFGSFAPVESESLSSDRMESTEILELTFVIDHKTFPTSAVEAMVRSPAVGEQREVDAWARGFVFCDPEIDSTDFSSP